MAERTITVSYIRLISNILHDVLTCTYLISTYCTINSIIAGIKHDLILKLLLLNDFVNVEIVFKMQSHTFI
jgi:hypothetical protein